MEGKAVRYQKIKINRGKNFYLITVVSCWLPIITGLSIVCLLMIFGQQASPALLLPSAI